MPHTRNAPQTVPPFEQVGNKLIDIEAAVELDCIHLEITALGRRFARLPLREALKAIDFLNDELVVAGLNEEKGLLQSSI
jgi:hypothetical protein